MLRRRGPQLFPTRQERRESPVHPVRQGSPVHRERRGSPASPELPASRVRPARQESRVPREHRVRPVRRQRPRPPQAHPRNRTAPAPAVSSSRAAAHLGYARTRAPLTQWPFNQNWTLNYLRSIAARRGARGDDMDDSGGRAARNRSEICDAETTLNVAAMPGDPTAPKFV
jgi:hypothetical protein